LSRKAHPYFGRLNRLDGAGLAPAGGPGGRAPPMTADEQPGVLWQAFREESEPA
jgi:hypothetical protein